MWASYSYRPGGDLFPSYFLFSSPPPTVIIHLPALPLLLQHVSLLLPPVTAVIHLPACISSLLITQCICGLLSFPISNAFFVVILSISVTPCVQPCTVNFILFLRFLSASLFILLRSLQRYLFVHIAYYRQWH